MQAAKFLVFLALGATVSGSPNVPIWELLSHQEKMGRLMYVFIHLVDNYCKGSNIPDCNKVLTLYGMSNLVNEDDNALNRMNPYQRNSRSIIWEKVMRGDFKLLPNKSLYSNSLTEEARAEEDYANANEVGDSPSSYQVNQRINKLRNDPHPYAVRVQAPSKASTTQPEKIRAPQSSRPALSSAQERRADNIDIAVGSSHPYAVRVLPGPTRSAPIQADIKAPGDYEPMMMESQVHQTRALPPTLTTLKRTKRSTKEVFPEEEMQSLLLQVLSN